MTDIATLGVKFTIIGADQAAAGMNRVAVAADKVESEVGAASRAIGTLGGKATASTGAIGKATASMIEWKNSSFSTAGAVDKVVGSLTGMNAQSQSNQNSIEAVSIKAKDLKDVLIEMGTRMASGDSPFMIGLQQGGKLGEMLSGSGGLTGIVGGLSKAFLSMLNPISLVAQAVTMAGAAVIQYFISSGRDIKSADEILKQHAQHIAELGPAYEKIAKEREKAIRLSPVITEANLKDDQKAAAATLQAEARKASGSILGDISRQQAVYSDQMIAFVPATTFDAARDAIARYNKSIEDGAAGTEKFQKEILTLRESGKLTEAAANQLRQYTMAALEAEQKLSAISAKSDPITKAFADMQEKIDDINPFGASKLQGTQQALDDLRRNLQAAQITIDEFKAGILALQQARPDLSAQIGEIGRLGVAAAITQGKIEGMRQVIVAKADRLPTEDEARRRAKNFDDRFGDDNEGKRLPSATRDSLIAGLVEQQKVHGIKSKEDHSDPGFGGGNSQSVLETANAYDTLQNSVQSSIEQLRTEAQTIGLNSIAVETLKMNLELLHATEDKSHAAAPGQIQDIKNKIAQYNALATATANAKLEGDIQFQQAQMGRSTVDQTVASTQKQYGLPVDMNSASAGIIRHNEQLKYARELAGDFATTLVNGLRSGEGFWKSMGNAAVTVLKKISDKLLNDVLNSLFQVNSAASGGGGGGLLSGLLGIFGFGGGSEVTLPTGSNIPIPMPRPSGFANGGYTGSGGVYDPAGIVHAGEVVWSQRDIARAGGVGVVEAMRLGRRGYADGGVVGEGGPQLLRAQPDAAVPVRRLRADNQNDASGSASGVHVTVGVSVDEDGNLKAYVKNVAQSEAQSSTRQGLNDFNQQLPDRVAQINRNPRRR